MGQHLGWRAAFISIAAFGLCAVAGLLVCLPRCQVGGVAGVRRELQVLHQPSVIVALLTTVLGASAMLALYAYIAPILETVSHASPLLVTAMLALIGIGFTIGNAVGSRLSDRHSRGTLLGGFAVIVAVMLALPRFADDWPDGLMPRGTSAPAQLLNAAPLH